MVQKGDQTPTDPSTPTVQTVLEVLMRKVPKPERVAIMERTGYGTATWWNWCRRPRVIPGAALNEIIKYLEKAHGRAFTTDELYKPVV